MEICPRCGLPKEACICEQLAKTTQKIKVTTVKKKYGKFVTVVSGINPHDVNVREVAKQLKTELACGGTIKDNNIELQGEHTKKVKEKLIQIGFSPETIE